MLIASLGSLDGSGRRRRSLSRHSRGRGRRFGRGGGACGGGSPYGRGRLDLRDHRAHPHDLALAGVDLDQRALKRGGDLGVDLVGNDLDDRLVALHELALALQPLLDGSLGDRLAELRHLDLGDTHAESSLAASPQVANRIRSA